MGEEISLGSVAAEHRQAVPGVAGFDAFGQHDEAEAMAELGHVCHLLASHKRSVGAGEGMPTSTAAARDT